MDTVPHPVRLLSALLRIFFKLLYHQFAWAYDWVAALVSLGRWNDWVLATLPELIGPRILEIGHGPGHLQLALSEKGVPAYGLDESRQMGHLTLRRLKKRGFDSRVARGVGQYLPYASSSFNQVVATFPSEYILEPLTLREVRRVLVPGGTLVVTPLAWIVGKGWKDQLAARLFLYTGQAPSLKDSEWLERWAEPIQAAGLIMKVERRSLGSSLLLIIRGQKPEP